MIQLQKKKAWKNSSLNRIRNLDLCDIGPPAELSNQLEAGHFVDF